MINRLFALVLGATLAACFMGSPAISANLRMHASGTTTSVCPNGTGASEFDLCADAPATGYINPDLLTQYVLDEDGNPATIHHGITNYNAAAFNFRVANSCDLTASCHDPADMSFQGTASVSGTTITWTTNVNGGTPKAGMSVWQAPSTAQANLADDPKIVSCDDVTSLPYVCHLDKNEGTKGASTYNASFARGCLWKPTGGFNNADLADWRCDFRNAAAGATADLSDSEWGPVGGHNASTLRVTAGSSTPGVYYTIKCWRCHFAVDSEMDSNAFITVANGAKGHFDIRYSDANGGNDDVAVGAPASSFVYKNQTLLFNLGGSCGESMVTPVTINVRFNRIHGFAGNPLAPSHCNVKAWIAANYFEKNGENNGDDPPYTDATELHGSILGQWQNTSFGRHAEIHIWNNTIGTRYGYRDAATTAAAAILSGHGTAHVIDWLDVNYNTILVNLSSTGFATATHAVNPFQLAAVTKYTAKGNRFNTIGIANCFSLGTDLASTVGSAWSITSTPDAPNNRSTATMAGFAGGNSMYWPGQYLNVGAASSAIQFTASSVRELDGTGTLTIASTQVGSTSALAVGTQIWTLRGADPMIITGGSGTSYTFSNGVDIAAGSKWGVGFQILPFGTDGTTATNSSVSAMNGTVRLSGLFTNATNHNVSGRMKPGNWATIDADFTDNYAMQIEGSAGEIKYDTCPGTTPVD